MTSPTPDSHLAQIWWENLTRPQQRFLFTLPLQNYTYNATQQERIEIWFEFAKIRDLHSLPGWPETTESDLRKI